MSTDQYFTKDCHCGSFGDQPFERPGHVQYLWYPEPVLYQAKSALLQHQTS